jgi:PAS domain S-box-containing protein
MGGFGQQGNRAAKTPRFPKDFWLSATVVLTRTTPITKINHFCVNNGFFMSDLAGFTADDKRASLFQVLDAHGWPDGYDGFMRARNEPQAARSNSARSQRFENQMAAREPVGSSVPPHRPHSARDRAYGNKHGAGSLRPKSASMGREANIGWEDASSEGYEEEEYNKPRRSLGQLERKMHKLQSEVHEMRRGEPSTPESYEDEPARRLMTNHVGVLRDATNPNPKTQPELKRVEEKFKRFVEQGLRECLRRLLGAVPGADQLEERLEASEPAQAVCWSQMAVYLNGRIAAPRDMSEGAAAAMRAVLMEIKGAADSASASSRLDFVQKSKGIAAGAKQAGGQTAIVGPDAQLSAMAAAMGVKAPTPAPWFDMLCSLLESLPQAAVVVDMTVPGIYLQYVNGAAERLTGYTKADAVGRNCRFMQGNETEASSVRSIVSAIRQAKAATVRVTNYKKNGQPFVNVLTVHPVNDSAGTYRYSIGVQSDAANEAAEGAALAKLRSVLPTRFDAAAQPKNFDYDSLIQVDMAAQKKQWASSLAKFTRLLWSMDWEGSLRQLVSQPGPCQAFGEWLRSNAPSDLGDLEALVNTQSANALASLSAGSFPKFVQSKACLPLVEQLTGGAEMRTADHLIWPDYKVPPDCAGWIHSFVQAAETYPSCIVISDMSMPGNPMFFANAEFCRVTGYAKNECQGRNCRFLQGPQTQPQSVAVLQDTLRRGVDCHVKLTNYRKSGELFENLLTMRPVHDSNGVYRFCIGVQFEVTRDMNLKSRLAKLDKLIKLLPATLEVSSQAVGVAHERTEVKVETETELTKKLDSAMAGSTVGAPAAWQAAQHRPARAEDQRPARAGHGLGAGDHLLRRPHRRAARHERGRRGGHARRADGGQRHRRQERRRPAHDAERRRRRRGHAEEEEDVRTLLRRLRDRSGQGRGLRRGATRGRGDAERRRGQERRVLGPPSLSLRVRIGPGAMPADEAERGDRYGDRSTTWRSSRPQAPRKSKRKGKKL